MANLENVQDPELRSRLEEAHRHLSSGKPTEAVRACSEIFLDMLKDRRVREATAPARGGRRVGVATRWPSLGANLSIASLRAGDPKIEFVRERFAMSEAITYYEFTVETAIARSRTPQPD